jgi:hypothetical protein
VSGRAIGGGQAQGILAHSSARAVPPPLPPFSLARPPSPSSTDQLPTWSPTTSARDASSGAGSLERQAHERCPRPSLLRASRRPTHRPPHLLHRGPSQTPPPTRCQEDQDRERGSAVILVRWMASGRRGCRPRFCVRADALKELVRVPPKAVYLPKTVLSTILVGASRSYDVYGDIYATHKRAQRRARQTSRDRHPWRRATVERARRWRRPCLLRLRVASSLASRGVNDVHGEVAVHRALLCSLCLTALTPALARASPIATHAQVRPARRG